ncbi:septum formation initiator [Marinococcus halophilus]|uniref:Septum formation initiator n=1 Tax=Marinococcus halophilus TaxID=1371 RepID=A0A510Y1X0_MARHA|nr:DivIVA domain-containing protein [Marinococcus halophilus]OZT81374.1 septum formation initiator [Marinococcus halophilus]GEK57325.1 septum formation initiator [Marinococcus halophilus]
MPLTPLDIHNKEFTRGFRGYDEDEVNDFLKQLIKDFEDVIRERDEMYERTKELEDRINHFSNIEETLNKSIYVAQESAEEVRKNARKEGELTVKEAEKNADRIVNEALNKSRRIELEIEELKKQASVYQTKFKMLLEAQMEMLHSDEWLNLSEEEAAEAEVYAGDGERLD